MTTTPPFRPFDAILIEPDSLALRRLPLAHLSTPALVDACRLRRMSQLSLDDLVDARGVAELLGLSQPNSVSTYQHRYSDMPRPVLDLGEGRCKLWLKQEVEAWTRLRQART